MYDIFDCVKAQIYYNPNKKSLAEIKRETGCTHAINGYLFNKQKNPGDKFFITGAAGVQFFIIWSHLIKAYPYAAVPRSDGDRPSCRI